VIKVIRTLWPGVIIQRCIVHVQRQGLSWCRRSPREASTKRLRELFLRVSSVHTKEERDLFITLFTAWEEKYGCYIASHPEKGRVFSDLKRARSMLLKALPDMFHYLDDTAIPSSTNGLESYFSRLKNHYRQHRGLSKRKLTSYFKWYLFYKPK
jgi:transposase-like protein